MIPHRLKIVLIIGVLLFLLSIFYLLKQKKLALRYTLLWLVTGVVMLILVAFPSLMNWIAKLIGMQSTMNTLYVLLIAFLILLTISLTSIVSGQTEKIRMLTQQSALLEKRIRELEQKKTADSMEKK